jgi:hypothetical protein
MSAADGDTAAPAPAPAQATNVRGGLRHFTWFGPDVDIDVNIQLVFIELYKDEPASIANKTEVLVRKRKYFAKKRNPPTKKAPDGRPAKDAGAAGAEAGGSKQHPPGFLKPGEEVVDDEKAGGPGKGKQMMKDGAGAGANNKRDGFIDYNQDGTVWKTKCQVSKIMKWVKSGEMLNSIENVKKRVEETQVITVFLSSPFDGLEVERSIFREHYSTQLENLCA